MYLSSRSIRRGEGVLHYVPDAARALDQARGRGALVHLVGPVASRAEALDAIGAALNFPAWYGRNLDALYDCLVDLSWQPDGEHVLIWAGHRSQLGAPPVRAARRGLSQHLHVVMLCGQLVGTQDGGRLSVKARMPSWPSADAKRAADSSSIAAKYCAVVGARSSCLVRASASGPPLMSIPV
jgi:Barstar (barnase inhibitor)